MTDPRLPDALIAEIVRRVTDLPDRTHPDDWPDAMLVTGDELQQIIQAVLAWRPIATAPKDGTAIIGALIRDGRVWRVHEMKHNGLAFYTLSGGSLPAMTHWTPLPPAERQDGTP